MFGFGVFERNISYSFFFFGGKVLEKSYRSSMGAWFSLVVDYNLLGNGVFWLKEFFSIFFFRYRLWDVFKGRRGFVEWTYFRLGRWRSGVYLIVFCVEDLDF